MSDLRDDLKALAKQCRENAKLNEIISPERSEVFAGIAFDMETILEARHASEGDGLREALQGWLSRLDGEDMYRGWFLKTILTDILQDPVAFMKEYEGLPEPPAPSLGLREIHVSIYDPSCSICRDQAGKPRAWVGDYQICNLHAQEDRQDAIDSAHKAYRKYAALRPKDAPAPAGDGLREAAEAILKAFKDGGYYSDGHRLRDFANLEKALRDNAALRPKDEPS